MVVRLLHEGDDGAHPLARSGQLEEPGVVATHRDLGIEVLEQIAGQAELGEDDEVRVLPASVRDELMMPREVAGHITESWRDLGEGDADRGHGRSVGAGPSPSSMSGAARARGMKVASQRGRC